MPETKGQLKERRDGLKKQLEKMNTSHPRYNELERQLSVVKNKLKQLRMERELETTLEPKQVQPKAERRLPPMMSEEMPKARLERENAMKARGFSERFRQVVQEGNSFNSINPLSSLKREQRDQLTIAEKREVNDIVRKENEDTQIENSLRQMEKDEEKEEKVNQLDKQFVNGAVEYLTGAKVNMHRRGKQGKEIFNELTGKWETLQQKSNTYSQYRQIVPANRNLVDDISEGISSPAGEAATSALQWGKNPLTMAAGVAMKIFE
jgi:hypothetical protein